MGVRKKKIENRIIKANLFLMVMGIFLFSQIYIHLHERKLSAYKTASVIIKQLDSVIQENYSNLTTDASSLLKIMPPAEEIEIFVAEKQSGKIIAYNNHKNMVTNLWLIGVDVRGKDISTEKFFKSQLFDRGAFCAAKESKGFVICVGQYSSDVIKDMWYNILFIVVYLTFCFVLFVIITKKMNAHLISEEKLMRITNLDGLTQLYNRRCYEADTAIYKYKYPEKDFVFISVDINGLKAANDNFGHAAGDELIIGTAQCLRDAFKCFGKIYRTGGDEFIAILHTTKNVDDLIKDLRDLTECWHGKLMDKLTVSVGCAVFSEFEDPNIMVISKAADERMYADKTAFYNREGIDRRTR